MLGFGRKSKAGEEKKAQRAETGTEQTQPPPVSLRLREPGGLLAPQQPASAPKPEKETKLKLPLGAKDKTKLHIMTGREERERAFQVAREHYLSKNLPSIRQENRRKERSHAVEYVTDRLIAVVGFFLIICGWIWLYQHGAELETWWKSLIDSIQIM